MQTPHNSPNQVVEFECSKSDYPIPGGRIRMF